MNICLDTSAGWYEFLQDMGSLIGGGFALVAGIVAYLAGLAQAHATRDAANAQIKAAKLRYDEEVETVVKSIAVELRQTIIQAIRAHTLLLELTRRSTDKITWRMVENVTALPAPIIYPAVADRIGLLKDEAMNVVIIYSFIEIGRAGVERIRRSREPDDISTKIVEKVADAFLQACLHARSVLPKLRTGSAFHDKKDEDLIRMISNAAGAASGPSTQ